MTGSRAVDWRVVAQRELAVKLTDKVFLGSTAFMLIATVLAIGVSTFFSSRVDRPEVAVVGAEAVALVEAADELARADDSDVSPTAVEVDDAAAAERLVSRDEASAALLPEGDGWEIVGTDDVDGSLQRYLGEAVAADALARNADDAGVTVGELQSGAELGVRLLDPDALPEEIRYIAGFAFAFLFYVTALTFGMAIAQSVVEEKQSRVVEILAAAVPIRAMLWGKILGNSVLALGQVVLLVAVGLGGLVATGRSSALDGIGPAAAWYVVFFVLGFVALASFWSVAGSLATRQEDLQTTTLPGQIVLLVPYLLAVTGSDKVQEVVSMLPIVSAMTMPGRIADGTAAAWQIAVAVVLTLVTAVALVRLGSRLYARSLLQTSRRMGYREALSAQS